MHILGMNILFRAKHCSSPDCFGLLRLWTAMLCKTALTTHQRRFG